MFNWVYYKSLAPVGTWNSAIGWATGNIVNQSRSSSGRMPSAVSTRSTSTRRMGRSTASLAATAGRGSAFADAALRRADISIFFG
ncbi:MAG: hypothetical protein U0521_15480 [Anaerolineae bacterium]